jgi:glycosyltransferase involved in cell wall biosynthesis
MTPLLAILIPYTPDRKIVCDRVTNLLYSQINEHPVIIIKNLTRRHKDGGPTTGFKRNQLLEGARNNGASHVAFVDSDDLVSPNYIEAVMPGVYGDYDCCELWGQYYENGKQMNPFHHSIVHDRWWQDSKFYYRNPNHLNVIKLSLLNNIKFKDQTIGEDGHFSIAIHESGVLKNEYPIKEIIYYYFAGGNKNHIQEPGMAQRRGVKL